MKRIKYLVSLIILISTSSFSQELLNNFKQEENGLIYWQIVIESQLTSTQVNEHIKESGYFMDIVELEEKTLCDLKPFKANFKAYGYSNMKTPFYISRSLVRGNVIFEYKENKYRVTIKNIVFVQNVEDVFAKQGEVETFESWVLSNSQKIKPEFFNDGSDILNKEFITKTSFNKAKPENW